MKTTSPPAEARIALVEDNPDLHERLAQIINTDPHMKVCAAAGSIRNAMEVIETSSPDVAIVDISLNETAGLALIKSLKTSGLKVPVLVIAMQDESLYAEQLLRGGASGCLSRSECLSEIKAAIRKIVEGDVYLSPRATSALLQRIMSPQADPRFARIALLTDRELEVFRLLGAGLKIREIADDLHMSITAVNNHRFRIRRKLEMKSTAELYYHAANWEAQAGMKALQVPGVARARALRLSHCTLA